jgi:hypothetical protein
MININHRMQQINKNNNYYQIFIVHVYRLTIIVQMRFKQIQQSELKNLI